MGHRCTDCGYATGKWMGFCPQCRSHGSLVAAAGSDDPRPTPIAEVRGAAEMRRQEVGIGEVDRVLGGGLVTGSVALLGGEPGVGKSTLLLQLCAAMAQETEVLYISGEESAHQVAMRAQRIGALASRLEILTETDIEVVERVVAASKAGLVVLDSVQTAHCRDVDGAPGGVTQVRECGARLAALARSSGVPILVVGHVTKDGVLAGPKVLEHLVDVVLYLEGDPDRGLRYLRGIKNRHGSVDQVGVFEMTQAGMVEVPDPSGLFVGEWSGGVAGTVVYPALYGRRSLLVEVQALVTPSSAPQPRRSVKGVEAARVHQLLAVLERHGGIVCGDHEVYVNVVGGLTIRDPAADLAVALAVASARLDRPLGPLAAFGEVGLTGEIRGVAHSRRRSDEAARFGIAHTLTADGADRLERAVVMTGLGEEVRAMSVAARG